MRAKALLATVLLLVASVAGARVSQPRSRRTHATRALRPSFSITSVDVARLGRFAPEVLIDTAAPPAPTPAPRLRAVLPPGVLAALIDAAAKKDEPPIAKDGLSWRELRPSADSRTRIVPLAFGRF